MPHLPTNRLERKEADLERRVERIQRDHRSQRQRVLRNRAYFYAYLILGYTVCALLTIGLVVFILVSENDAVTLTSTWDQALGLVMSLTLLISLLPSMVVAWSDVGEQSIELCVGA